MIAKPVSSVIATLWLMCYCKTYVCFATTGLCVIAEPDSFFIAKHVNLWICKPLVNAICKNMFSLFACLWGKKVMYDYTF
jgi:hypothetical protein